LLTAKEKKLWRDHQPSDRYPQRDAVLEALRGLTGKNPGKKTEDWQKLYQRAETIVAAEKLGKSIVRASPQFRAHLIKRHRDGTGEVHTLALARAAALLKGKAQEQVRAALTERLKSLRTAEVRSLMADDVEVRKVGKSLLDDKK